MHQLKRELLDASNAGTAWLLEHRSPDGSYGPDATDLAYYYKSPSLFLNAGHYPEAHQSIELIRKRFMFSKGDFRTSQAHKSIDPLLAELDGYMNGWIALGALRLGRFDIAYPARKRLRQYAHKSTGGGLTHAPRARDGMIDLLSTAHLGLVNLYFGRKKRARRAGFALAQMLTLQPERESTLYLRMHGDSELITRFPVEAATVHRITTLDSHSAYFMLGYPIGFLCKLWLADPFGFWPELVRELLNFAHRCGEPLIQSPWSHSVAWGAALAAHLSGEKAYTRLAAEIARALLRAQDSSGAWHPSAEPPTTFDQTAETSFWLRELATLL